MSRSTLVIGGGIGGLACAHRLSCLARSGGESRRITVLEAGVRWGGVIASERHAGFLCERGPDAVLTAKPAAIELMRELGLGERIIAVSPAARRTLIARGRRLVPVPDGLYLLAPGKLWPFVTSSAISWLGKLRMLGDLVAPRRSPGVDEESLAAFVRRRLGREALERLAQPLIGGIYSADPEVLSIDAAMPQFVAMEREHRSLILAMMRRSATTAVAGPRYGLFASLVGGLEELVTALVDRLAGVDLRLRSPVMALERVGAGWRARSADGVCIDADEVVIAGPAHVAGRLLTETAPALATDLGAIPYRGVATVNLGFRGMELPESAGFVVPAVEGRSISACTFASRKFAGRAPTGDGLVRAAVGHGLSDGSNEAVCAGALADLRVLVGGALQPEVTLVTRHPCALAQPVLGHAARVARIRAAQATLPGLALVGNGYEGSGIPDVITQAEAAARRLAPGQPA